MDAQNKNAPADKDIEFSLELNRAAAVDVHKKELYVCIMGKGIKKQVRRFGTFTADLHSLRDWLKENSIGDVGMESTGVYWRTLYAVLEESGMNVTLANAYSVKQIPGKKTDMSDAQWLCKLMLNGLIRKSFIPPREQRALRPLTRQRMKYEQQISSVQSRMAAILESCNIKLRSVISNLDTQTGMGIIRALAKGETDMEKLLALCKGKVRKKLPQMRLALDGRLTHEDRQMLQMYLDDFDHLTAQRNKLDAMIDAHIEKHFAETRKTLEIIPGLKSATSASFIAEAGNNMNQFPTADHFTSWLGLAPGNYQSADKRKKMHTIGGNGYARWSMVCCAWAAVKTKNTYWKSLFEFLTKKKKMPGKKAIVVIARKMSRMIYGLLLNQLSYSERGTEYLLFNKQKQLQRQLERLQQNNESKVMVA